LNSVVLEVNRTSDVIHRARKIRFRNSQLIIVPSASQSSQVSDLVTKSDPVSALSQKHCRYLRT